MKKFLVVFLVVLGMCTAAYASEYEISGEEVYNNVLEETVSGKFVPDVDGIIQSIAKNIFSEISESKEMLRSVFLIAAASGILRILSDSFGETETSNAAFFACFLLMASCAVKIFGDAAGYGAEIIHTLCGFITKFEPIFIGVLVSSGAVVQAGTFSPVMSACVYVLSVIVDKAILPMAYCSAALGIVNNISNRIEIGTFNKLIQSITKWMLTAVLTLFSAILALYGFGASAFNNVAAKGLKFAVGSFVPVVGGILSDTVDTVLAGTGLLKNAVGTAGMIAVIAAAGVPVIKIWIMMMLLKLTAAATEPFADKRITGLLISLADSIASVFSMVMTAAVLFVISIGIILMSTGVNL